MRDVVDRVVRLAEAVGEHARRRGVEAPGRGDVVAPGRGRQPVEVVVDEGLDLRPADGVAKAAEGEAAGRLGSVLQLGDVADLVVCEVEVVEGVADRQRRVDVGEALGVRVIGASGKRPAAKPFPDGKPLAEVLWQVSPGRSGTPTLGL